MTTEHGRSPGAWPGRILPALSWTATDQVLSSVSNLFASAISARAGGAEQLGQFTLLFTVYLIATGVQRALVTEPLMAQVATTDRGPDRSGLTATAVLSAAIAVLLVIGGFVLDNVALVVFGSLFPGLLIQDALRFIAFRRRDARRAAVLDLIWVVGMIAAAPIALLSGSLVGTVAVWAGSATLSAGFGFIDRSIFFAGFRAAITWWRQEARRMGVYLGLESVMYTITIHGVTFGLAGLIGVAELGSLRGAFLLLSPATAILPVFNVVMLPRLSSRRSELTRREAFLLSLSFGVVCLLVVSVCVLASPLTQPLLLGDKVIPRLDVLLLLGVATAASACTAGLVLHLKVMQRVGWYSAGRVGAAIIGLPLTLVAAVHFSLQGAVMGILIQSMLMAGSDVFVWWRMSARSDLSRRSKMRLA